MSTVIKSAQVTFGFATEAASEERKAEERKRKVRKRNIFDETVLRALPAPASFINIRLSADTYSSVRGGISLLSFPKNINLPFLNWYNQSTNCSWKIIQQNLIDLPPFQNWYVVCLQQRDVDLQVSHYIWPDWMSSWSFKLISKYYRCTAVWYIKADFIAMYVGRGCPFRRCKSKPVFLCIRTQFVT